MVYVGRFSMSCLTGCLGGIALQILCMPHTLVRYDFFLFLSLTCYTFVGEAKHVVQGILVGGGMFTKRKANKPLERFQTFLENVWLPGTFNKVSANVQYHRVGRTVIRLLT